MPYRSDPDERRQPVLRADWNSLRPGDRVMVHHTTDDGGVRLLAGVVATVASGGGANDVAVRVSHGGTRLVHPGRLSVHHDPIEFDGHCWRCSAGEA